MCRSANRRFKQSKSSKIGPLHHGAGAYLAGRQVGSHAATHCSVLAPYDLILSLTRRIDDPAKKED